MSIGAEVLSRNRHRPICDGIIDVFAQLFQEKNVSYSENYCDFQLFLKYFLIKSDFNSCDVFTELFRTKCLRTAKIIAIFSNFCYFEIKPEMRDALEKMREISQNAGFPARLRDG